MAGHWWGRGAIGGGTPGPVDQARGWAQLRRIVVIGNAISRAIGIRMTDLPMSPPKLSEAIDEAAPRMAAD